MANHLVEHRHEEHDEMQTSQGFGQSLVVSVSFP